LPVAPFSNWSVQICVIVADIDRIRAVWVTEADPSWYVTCTVASPVLVAVMVAEQDDAP
jgi:hypothetical protein